MSKRLQVLIVEDEYLEIQEAARRRHMTVSEWIRRTLRKAMDDQPGTAEAKLHAIVDASRHSFPTADIETMLGETASIHAPASSAGAEPLAER